MIKKVMNFIKEEEGAGLAEYALLLVLIALASIAILTTMGTTIANVFQRIVDGLTAA
jgi:pilus assembly protein Flp/PilA